MDNMRWGRGFLLFAVVAALLGTPAVASAGCASDPTSCMPSPPPPPPPTPTPKPTPKPTTKPTAAPTQHPYVPPVSQQTTPTDEPTTAPVEVGSPVPAATAEVTVPGPAFNTLPSAPIDQVHNSASLTTWFFGFIAGFLVGALIGRASWGVSRRRRRQQIFG